MRVNILTMFVMTSISGRRIRQLHFSLEHAIPRKILLEGRHGSGKKALGV